MFTLKGGQKMKIAVYQNKWNDDINQGLQNVLVKTEDVLKEYKPDFFVLPEFFVGPPWFQPGQTFLKGITDDTIPGKICTEFCNLAKKNNSNIIMGTLIERRNNKYYNTSVFINKQGIVKAKVNKMHTFAGESVTCEASKKIDIIETDFGAIGIAVCSDFWIPELMKILSLKGAKIIFVPGGTLGQNTEPMIQALKTISYLTSTIVVYASPVGEIVGKRGNGEVRLSYTGTSLIVSPEGTIATGCDNDEDVLVVNIDDDYIDNYRNNNLCWERFNAQKQSIFGDIISDYIDKDCDISELMEARMHFDNDKKILQDKSNGEVLE